jgi:hypothetical protein
VAGLGSDSPYTAFLVLLLDQDMGRLRRAESCAQPAISSSLTVVIAHRARLCRPVVNYILTRPSWNSHTGYSFLVQLELAARVEDSLYDHRPHDGSSTSITHVSLPTIIITLYILFPFAYIIRKTTVICHRHLESSRRGFLGKRGGTMA